jgi:hypothetical protein
MKLMGIGDEAGARLETQLAATHDLGWEFIELRAAELPGHPKANFHDLRDAKKRGYAAGVSIEPHMVTVFHAPEAKVTAAANISAARQNFVAYGQRLGRLLP